MKKVICTILAMVTLSTSVSAATNVKTFGTDARNMLNGVTHGSNMYMYRGTLQRISPHGLIFFTGVLFFAVHVKIKRRSPVRASPICRLSNTF